MSTSKATVAVFTDHESAEATIKKLAGAVSR